MPEEPNREARIEALMTRPPSRRSTDLAHLEGRRAEPCGLSIPPGWVGILEELYDTFEALPTPPGIIQAFGPFDLDPCAPVKRPWATADNHYTIEDDGLLRPWQGLVWCNPPYGPKTGDWLARCAQQLGEFLRRLRSVVAERADDLWRIEMHIDFAFRFFFHLAPVRCSR